jgi:crotonobetainyl-CoA:carnitine CoA-transferase CaiB-like acyl-CoA transferase
MTETTHKPPLWGLKVLDFSQNLPGPYATFLLSGWGADVVKVEPPKGDPGRFMEPFFSMVNRGKRSVVLDLREEASRPALEALVKWADVLVEGFRPGVMARLGCGFDDLRALNPHLVYCSISAFGQEGPLALHPGHDLNLQAISGACHLERDARGTPRPIMLPIADLSSSLLAVSGICAALARGPERDAVHLDVAMADGVQSWSNVWGVGIDLAGNAKKQLGGGALVSALTRPLVSFLERAKLYAMPHYDLYATKDGAYLSLGIVDEDHFWKALCEELGLGPIKGLPLPARIAGGPAIKPVIARRLRTRTRDEWLRRFEAAGVPASAVRAPTEVPDEPQVRARGMFDARGWMGSPLPGAVPVTTDAPTRGQHTSEVLSSLGVG